MMQGKKTIFPRIVTGLMGGLLLAVLAAGSAQAPTFQGLSDFSRVAIPYGTLVNEDIRIESTGSSWTQPWSVAGGQDFSTPFSVYWWRGQAPDFNSNTVLNGYQEAYEKGARPVLIHIDGREDPIHGLIVFNDAIGSAYGPGRQSYYLQIPEEKIRQAVNGNITVAFERMQWKDEYRNSTGYHSNDKRWFSWVLWMSRTPLVRETRRVGMPGN